MRIKSSVTQKARHKKILKANKGYRGTKSRLYQVAHEAYLHAGQYAYVGRKNRKRTARRDWILRISEATKLSGIPYNKFIFGLKKANIELDRKILSDMVLTDPKTFQILVDRVTKLQ